MKWLLTVPVALAACLLAVLLFSGCVGQRYLQVRVERDGDLVLQTKYGVPDRLGASDIWQSLQGKPFKAVGTVTPDAANGQKVVLKGKIKITILHGDKAMASASVDELRFVRASGCEDRWELPPEEVQRTAKTAGL